jgi:hypothetical protein
MSVGINDPGSGQRGRLKSGRDHCPWHRRLQHHRHGHSKQSLVHEHQKMHRKPVGGLGPLPKSSAKRGALDA